ncbi:MAG: MBL fold metallo-hydrolase [Methanomicrobiales archaeon]|nr:MBL fold metallo-hydrolase [Methanomicrobiales archaeon]
MEITPRVHRIDKMRGNCYLIARDGLVLIDTGLPRTAGRISACIARTLHRSVTDLHTIILTHYHMDHVGNVPALVRATGAQVVIHEGDAPYLSGEKSMPLPSWPRSLLIRMVKPFLGWSPVRPDILLRDGDTIAGLTCIHTPGHTPGSICLFDPEEKVLFSGDTLLTERGRIQGPSERSSARQEEATRSLARIASLDFEILLPGHGEPVGPEASARLREFLAPAQGR